MRDTLGGYPHDVKKEDGNTVIRFYPKSESATNPDFIRFTLVLGKDDLKKLAKIAS